jgi:hypothetical protein
MAEQPMRPTGGAPLNYSQVRKEFLSNLQAEGLTPEDIRRAGWHTYNAQDPSGPNPWAAKENVQWNEFEQGAVSDMLSGVYNELVLGLGEGIANIIPTGAQAMGFKAPMFENWIQASSDWFDKQKTVYSDSAYKPVKSFADYFQGGKFWSSLGEGIGFVMALVAPTKGMKGGWNKRMTSFGVGTTMMYSDLYDEAKQNGFSPQDAARIALATSGLVSLTEGAALEWIGKGATNWIPKDFARTALKGSFKEGAKFGPFDFYKNNKLFSAQLMKQIGSKEGIEVFKNAALKAPGNIVRGGTIEFGQEFAQTYIEDGIKEMYDTFISKTDFVDNSRMGSAEQFQEAVFGGIIGSIIGGGLGGASGVSNTLENNREAVIGYVSRATKNGQLNKVKKLYQHLDRSLAKEKITPEDHAKMKQQLDEAVEYGTQTKHLNIQSGKANAQLFDLLKTDKVVKNALQNTIETGDVHELIAQAYSRNAEKAGRITEKLDTEAKAIIENRQPITGSKMRFEKMLGDFKVLYADVIQNKVNDEQFEKRLAKIGIVSKEKVELEKDAEVEKVSTPGFEHMADEDIQARVDQIKSTPKYKKMVQAAKTGVAPSKEVEMLEQELLTRKQKRDVIQQELNQQQQSEELKEAGKVQENDQPVSAIQKEETEVVSDKDYNEFVNTGVANDYLISKIAKSISKGEKLSPRQQAIRMQHSADVEYELKDIQNKKRITDFESEWDTIIRQKKSPESIDEDLKAHLKKYGYKKEVKSEDDFDQAYDSVLDELKSDERKHSLYGRKIAESKETKEHEAAETVAEEKAEEKLELETLDFDDEGSPVPSYSKRVQHKGNEYIISSEGVIRNSKTNQFINPESPIGQSVLKEAGVLTEQEKPKDVINEAYDKKKNASKISGVIDFTKLGRIESDLNINSEGDAANQLTGFNAIEYDSRIDQNFELFQKLRDHFLKIFPGMTVDTVNALTDKYGNQVLGQVVGNAITINKNDAFQSTLLHEFAEVYVDILNDQDPYMVKRGLDFIKNTDYHEKAKILYADYSDQVQLKEALVQAIAEKSLETLVKRFEGNSIDRFVTWMKNFWTKIKGFFTPDKHKDVAQVLANDFALRTNPMQTVAPDITLRYQLGQKNILRDRGMTYIGNLVNSAVLVAKFNSSKENTNADATETYLKTMVALFDRYKSEIAGRSTGIKIFDGNTFDGLSNDEIQNNSWGENLNQFLIGFSNRYKERNEFIRNSIQTSLKGVVAEEIDHSVNEIKATKDISSNVRTILSSILDYETGSPVSKETVIRTVLSVADKTHGSTQFMQELNRKAMKGDFIAGRLKFILESIPKEYSTPVVRELSSLEQIEFTSVVLTKDEAGNPIFLKRIVNKDHNQEETVNGYINKLLVAVRNGKLNEHAEKIAKYSKLSDADKIRVTEEALKDVFGLSNFNFQFFSAITGYGLGSLIGQGKGNSKKGFIFKAVEEISKNTEEKDIRKNFGNYLTKISIAESELDVLQSNFVNTMGNRTPSVHLGSFFTNTRKNLNDKQYVARLKNQPLYKNNPIVKAIDKGMMMKVSRHDAVSNVNNNLTDEYSNQSTIDNKVNGLLRFAHSFLGEGSNQYDQWIGVTADRGYQTFFTAPKINAVDANNKLTAEAKIALDESAKRDQIVVDAIKSDWQSLSSGDLKKFVSVLQNMTIHDVSIQNGLIKVNANTDVNQSKKYKADIDQLIAEVNSLGIKELIEKQTETTLENLVNNYFVNDYLNRQALEDLFTGPLERHIIKTKLSGKKLKDISEPIKRMGLANAVGVLNEIDKPVRVIYLDTKGISDSFSFNGSHLQNRLRELGGSIDQVGSSIKDGLFQVDHFNAGQTVSMKMSTLGLERNVDADGNYIGNNFNDFTNADNTNPISISNIGDAIIALENYIGNDPYIKVVDTDVTKNEIPAGAQVMSIDEFIGNVNAQKFDDILAKSPEMNFTNYRTVFNLHKDISKVPLPDQTVKLGTQFSVIASNNDTKKEIDQIENIIVKALEKQLIGLPKLLLSTSNMVKATLLHADETQSTFTKQIMETIDKYNARVNARIAIEEVANNKALDTLESKEKELRFLLKQNPEIDAIVTELYNGKSIESIVDSYKRYKTPIETFDHPNLKYLMENTISNQLTKKGIDVKMAGNFLRVVPDFNQDLEFHNPETGKVSDIAVPWSMFGRTREEAETLLKNTLGGLRTIAVRIPTSGNTMIFAAKVKYFIEGKSNNVIAPKRWIEISDSDHDGDKTFVYRQEISDSGVIVPGLKTDLFNEYYKRVSDPRFIKRTLEESVDVKALISRAEAVKTKLTEVQEEVEKSLRTFEGTSQVANAMKDGLTSVGIFAVAVKSLSVMYQAGVNLKEPVRIDLGYKANPEDAYNQSIELKDISIDALEDTALYLQAALDNAKEMALSFAGVNKDNIGTVATMLVLGMNVEQITAITNNAEVRKYLNKINADASIYSMNPRQKKTVLKKAAQSTKRQEVIYQNTSVLPREELVAFLNATKDQKLNQPVETEMADGYYKSTVNLKKDTLYFQIKTVDGKKIVSTLSQSELYNSLISEDSNVLSSYFLLESIANEMSKITPIVQLDAGLNNNGYDNYKLQENIRMIQDPEEFRYFDVSGLNERIRYRHYMQMNNAQREIEKRHFITEHDGVYVAMDDLLFHVNADKISEKHLKMLMDETIQTMYAQKLLSRTIKESSKAEVDVWFDGFVKKMGTIKNLINGVSSNVGTGLRKNVLDKVNAGKELTAFDKQVYQKIKVEDSIMEEFSGTIENSNGQSMSIADFMKSNLFLQYLDVVKIKNQQKVILRKSFKSLSQGEMESVSASYNELMKTMPALANEILDYQLLTNGLNDKIGSYAILFPEHIHTDYLQTLSENTKNKDEVVSDEQLAFQLNTAMKIQEFIKSFPKNATNIKGGVYVNDGKFGYSDKDTFIPVEDKGFFTNGIYYKFGWMNDSSERREPGNPTQEQIDEIKKCLRNG